MRRLFMLSLLFAVASAVASDNPDWRAPLKPFQVTDNLYYVGSRDLAAYLVVTPEGNILINANLASSPPQIKASHPSVWIDPAGYATFVSEAEHNFRDALDKEAQSVR